ncbi:MAG: tRNA uridine-5-carboxymethylaminomethyl(34) synthesis GTPase MnmE [Peptostreptococcaceae bacterium]|nr:tRNA uridine-5-carboxymethylaminomethyl(34) synthesis GTPase MnmE [Peptostreptococcaceae bacterium]
MEDTIAAISTALGEGGIGIVRISGQESFDILNKIFVRENSKNEFIDRHMYYGNIVNPENMETIDEVLSVYMKAPNTYTCEDVVEINCHGSIISQKRILDLVLNSGARLAEPGEFTKRAFLNGRLDLSQAEAVIDLIKAKTDKGFNVAINHLQGGFSSVVAEIREELLNVLAQITVNIDYPDEDIEQVLYKEIEKKLKEVNIEIKELIDSAEIGRIFNEGIRVAIVGKPNVGKSSLMNSILGENRVIVTSVPGTTRDTIEESVNIGGIPIILTDTAGIRKSENEIEKHGIERSKEKFNNADLGILVLDSSRMLDEEDVNIIEKINDRKVLIVINKIDLELKLEEKHVKNMIPEAKIIRTSMKDMSGLKDVKKAIEEMFLGGKIKQQESHTVNNSRHKDLLIKAKLSIDDGTELIKKNEALEIVEIDINNAYKLLGEILGETIEDDIIDRVFSTFCLGK